MMMMKAPQGRKVLIAEDDPPTLTMLEDLMVALGWRVSKAQEGKQAFALFLEVKPDLVLLDIMMRPGGGVEVYRRIRKTFEGKDLPVLFITGKELHDHKHELMGEHTYVLQKPVQNRLLQRMINRLFPSPS